MQVWICCWLLKACVESNFFLLAPEEQYVRAGTLRVKKEKKDDGYEKYGGSKKDKDEKPWLRPEVQPVVLYKGVPTHPKDIPRISKIF